VFNAAVDAYSVYPGRETRISRVAELANLFENFDECFLEDVLGILSRSRVAVSDTIDTLTMALIELPKCFIMAVLGQ
jgi:hypothetical protein